MIIFSERISLWSSAVSLVVEAPLLSSMTALCYAQVSSTTDDWREACIYRLDIGFPFKAVLRISRFGSQGKRADEFYLLESPFHVVGAVTAGSLPFDYRSTFTSSWRDLEVLVQGKLMRLRSADYFEYVDAVGLGIDAVALVGRRSVWIGGQDGRGAVQASCTSLGLESIFHAWGGDGDLLVAGSAAIEQPSDRLLRLWVESERVQFEAASVERLLLGLHAMDKIDRSRAAVFLAACGTSALRRIVDETLQNSSEVAAGNAAVARACAVLFLQDEFPRLELDTTAALRQMESSLAAGVSSDSLSAKTNIALVDTADIELKVSAVTSLWASTESWRFGVIAFSLLPDASKKAIAEMVIAEKAASREESVSGLFAAVALEDSFFWGDFGVEFGRFLTKEMCRTESASILDAGMACALRTGRDLRHSDVMSSEALELLRHQSHLENVGSIGLVLARHCGPKDRGLAARAIVNRLLARRRALSDVEVARAIQALKWCADATVSDSLGESISAWDRWLKGKGF